MCFKFVTLVFIWHFILIFWKLKVFVHKELKHGAEKVLNCFMYCQYLTSGKALEKLHFYVIRGRRRDTESICSNSGIVENMRSEILANTKIFLHSIPQIFFIFKYLWYCYSTQ